MPDAHQVDLAVHRPTVREHLLAVLREADGFHIRRVVESAGQAAYAVQADPPDILLLGTELPDAPWQRTVRRILRAQPSIPIVAVSHCDAEHVARLLTQGLCGCIAEDEPTDEMLALLDAVAEGKVQFSRRVLRELIESRRSDAAPAALNERQRAVLGLLANGYDNKRIAAALLLSEGTVRNYVSEVYREIGVDSRVEAARWAWQHGVAQAA